MENIDDRVYLNDSFLEYASKEFKRIGNIDVFNNAFLWENHLDIWDKVGRPKEITNKIYAESPWFATLKALAQRDKVSTQDN